MCDAKKRMISLATGLLYMIKVMFQGYDAKKQAIFWGTVLFYLVKVMFQGYDAKKQAVSLATEPFDEVEVMFLVVRRQKTFQYFCVANYAAEP